MSLSEATLSDALEALPFPATEEAAALNLAAAYGTYMKEAAAGAVPIIGAAVENAAVPAMAAAMTLIPTPSFADGAAVFVAGVVAFWGALAAAPATFFAGATVVTPPLFPTLAADLVVSFTANVGTDADVVTAMGRLAADLHSATAGQGTATIPPAGPVVIL